MSILILSFSLRGPEVFIRLLLFFITGIAYFLPSFPDPFSRKLWTGFYTLGAHHQKFAHRRVDIFNVNARTLPRCFLRTALQWNLGAPARTVVRGGLRATARTVLGATRTADTRPDAPLPNAPLRTSTVTGAAAEHEIEAWMSCTDQSRVRLWGGRQWV